MDALNGFSIIPEFEHGRFAEVPTVAQAKLWARLVDAGADANKAAEVVLDCADSCIAGALSVDWLTA